MQNVCRTCMGDSVPLVNIFSDVRDPALEQPERNLSYIVSECTNRSVRRDDGQPQFICLTCVQAAQAAFRFKRQCNRSYQRFCELQNKNKHLEGNPDRDSQQAGHKEAPRAEDSRSDSSPAGPGGTNNKQKKLSQSFGGSESKQNCVKDNRFGCTHCPNSYRTKHGLKRHQANHGAKPTHKCPFCPKVFWRSDTYGTHVLSHGKGSPVFCKLCSAVFPDANQLEMHRREHDGESIGNQIPDDLDLEADKVGIQENSLDVMGKSLPSLEPVHTNICDLCSDSFLLEDDLKVHRILMHDVNITDPVQTFMFKPKRLDLSREDRTIEDFSKETRDDTPTLRLAECGSEQESISEDKTQSKSLKKQSKLRSTDMKRFECSTCQRSFKSKISMLKHQVTHISKPKHHCPVCSKAFWLRFKLIRHLRSHKDMGPHPCHQCSAIFIDRIHLKIHLKEHEEKSETPNSKDNDVDTADNNIDMIKDFRIHRRLSHHSDSQNPAAESPNISRDWIPESLDLSLESSTSDNSSNERSEDNPTSRQNGTGFDQETTSSAKVEKLKESSTTEAKRVECLYCQSTFKTLKGMRLHLNTHIVEPKYTCSVCSKPFWRSDYLAKHLLIHGVGERYSCSLCPAEFVDKKSCDQHKLNVHEKQNVKCRYCFKEYKSKKALENHENKQTCVQIALNLKQTEDKRLNK
ncbi:hypothetical protein KR032_007454 [Drosophila birchii]|nr:hypothetical protein KR032_007454 [Drosophila birchii]